VAWVSVGASEMRGVIAGRPNICRTRLASAYTCALAGESVAFGISCTTPRIAIATRARGGPSGGQPPSAVLVAKASAAITNANASIMKLPPGRIAPQGNGATAAHTKRRTNANPFTPSDKLGLRPDATRSSNDASVSWVKEP
jgi:hypothetical protein